jgi:alpha-tubulin suppressor-like RCC1 family protein
LADAVEVACGNYFSMALRANGTVSTWGDNAFGLRNVPGAATDLVAIGTRGYFALGLRRNGSLVMWGSQAEIPPEATNIVAIAPGGSHTLALRGDGELLAWGANNYGQCNVPGAATNVVAIRAGFTHSVALRQDGQVLVWGENIGGVTNVPPTATNVVAIDSGPNFILALRADGQVLAWGLDWGGNASVPSSATNLVALAAGQNPDFGIRADGSVVAWGRNDNGELNVPAGLAPAFRIAAGDIHSLGIRVTGGVSLWQQPSNRVVAAGDSVLFQCPAVGQVPLRYQWRREGLPLAGANSAALFLPNLQAGTGGNFDLVVSNNFGAVTSQVAVVSVVPTAPRFKWQPTNVVSSLGGTVKLETVVKGSAPIFFQWWQDGAALPDATNAVLSLSNLGLAAAGHYVLVASNSVGVTASAPMFLEVMSVFAWGAPSSGLLDLPGGLTNVVALAASPTHNLALRTDGSVVAWGDNAYNQCSAIAAETNLVAIDAGHFVSLGLRRDGSVVAYGNTYIAPAEATNVAAIAAGANYNLVLHSNGVPFVWGDFNSPVPPAQATNLVAIAAGTWHSLGLRADGVPVGWGHNGYGQSLPPTSATNLIAIAAGDYFSLGLRSDGQLFAWGANFYGQTNVPPAATNILMVAAGNSHGLALREDGRIFVWGETNSGQAQVPAALTFAAAVAGGNLHNLGLLDAGPLRWGRQPQSQSAIAGTRVALGGAAVGVGPMGYQWTHQGTNLPGATHAYLILADVQGAAAGDYALVITNSSGAITSSVATLTVTPTAPIIDQPPVGQVALPGSNVTLTVTAHGTAELSYQWFHDGTPLSGDTNSRLDLLNIQLGAAGHYHVVITNWIGSVTSAVAYLEIQPFNLTTVLTNGVNYSAAWGDFDNDGQLDLLVAGRGGAQAPVNATVRLYRNQGGGVLVETNAGFSLSAQSVAWGDFDNDGWLDVVANNGSGASIWRNRGTGTFTNVGVSLASDSAAVVAVVDYNNDGRLDVSLGSRLHRNRGNNLFTNITTGLPALTGGVAAWGDYDCDGWPDALVCGLATGSARFQLYRNLGTGAFTNVTTAGFPDIYRGMGAWLDYDADGWLDVVLSGETGPGVRTSGLYRNNGDGTFAPVNSGLPPTTYAWLAPGDYDNDGRADVALSGFNGTNYFSRIFRARTNGLFVADPSDFPTNTSGPVAGGDLDGDGRLDLAAVALSAGQPRIGLYHNSETFTNPPPLPPLVGPTSAGRNSIKFEWFAGSDGETPGAALTYALRVGRNPGAQDVLAAGAAPGGLRRLAASGNAGPRLSLILTNLTFGRYYWAGQTIDSGFRGSEFTAETNFAYFATTLAVTGLSATSATLQAEFDTNQLPAAAYFVWGAAPDLSLSTPLQNFGSNSPGTCSAPLTGLLAGTTYFYQVILTNGSGSYSGGVERFTTMAVPTITPLAPSNLTAATARLAATVNPNRSGTLVSFEYGLSPAYGLTTAVTNIGSGAVALPVTMNLTGLGGGQTYHYRVVASNSVGITVTSNLNFQTTTEPVVTTLSASNVMAVSATLHATVRPNTLPTLAWFEYGLTNWQFATPPLEVGSGANPVSVAFPLTNLNRVTLYQFRAVASNATALAVGASRTFTTTNDVIALAATSIGMTNAVLNGLVDPNGLLTTVAFEYGLTTNLGVSSLSLVLPATNGLEAVGHPLGGLLPGSNYFYRIFATNSAGVRTSATLSFQALPQFTPVASSLPGVSNGGMVWGDFDGDGRLDMLVSASTGTRLYRNLGAGNFTNLATTIPAFSPATVLGEDYNNDGRLDVLISGNTPSHRLYRNLGNNSFAPVNASLPPLTCRTPAWLDYDRDGRVDLLLAGETNGVAVTLLCRNLGDDAFAVQPLALPAYLDATAAVADYDNDGWPDIFLAGRTGTQYADVYAVLLRNTGAGGFQVTSNIFDGVRLGFAEWGDADGDGRLDLIYGGMGANLSDILRLYRNQPLGGFSNVTGALPQFACDAARWGDSDCDGRLDVLIRGQKYISSQVPSNSYSAWLRNNGDGTFALQNLPLPELWSSCGGWADYDNDGRLDFVILGNSRTGPLLRFYHNNNSSTNTPPPAPIGLTQTITNGEVRLAWTGIADAESALSGLTYNLRLGRTPGGGETLAPLAAPSGFRHVVARGNAGFVASSLLSNLPPATYYWSVQAIDGSFAGSAFASESSFVIPGAPVVSTLSVSNTTAVATQLRGRVFPNGLATESFFEWGTSTNLGAVIPLGTLAAAAPTNIFVAPLGGLTPGQAGYYRIAATNELGLTRGSILQFHTAGAPVALTVQWPAPGGLVLRFAASSGFPYRIWASPNLVDWVDLGLATDLGLNQYRFIDAGSSNFPARFYRIELPH